METLVIPNIDNIYMRERARDELPQSGSGKTIMTAEPKFIPEEAVEVTLADGASFKVRLIDCVGYMVAGAMGQFEDGAERMVTTPWHDHEISITQAAEEGTYKVVSEHSTISLVVTTDGSVCDIPREDYIPAEERVVGELKAIGKPFVILLNSAHPRDPDTQELAKSLEEKYNVPVLAVNCLEVDEREIVEVLTAVLEEFPVAELGVFLPAWVEALPEGNELKHKLYAAVRTASAEMRTVRDIGTVIQRLSEVEEIQDARIREENMGTGRVWLTVELPRGLYYDTISAATGLEIRDDGAKLM
jgi:stage IV sporulation protein A